MSAGDPAPKKQGLVAPWEPGRSGNPAGRPKGSRNKLGEGFLAALLADFEVHGPETIRLAREADPMGYVRVCASLLPRHVKVEDDGDRHDHMTDDELAARIRELDRIIAEVEGPDWLLRLRDDRREGW